MLSKWRGSVLAAIFLFTFGLYFWSPYKSHGTYVQTYRSQQPVISGAKGKFKWKDVAQEYPVASPRPVPTIVSSNIPRIQYNFKRESSEVKKIRLVRLQHIKDNFTHAWNGYREHAWLHDEVKSISGASEDPFGGWAASMVDSLGACYF
jgi:mannosyl-oligosaccharide alpha-1,2-mannosidase